MMDEEDREILGEMRASGDKEILEVMREGMSDAEKAAFDRMSAQEKREFVKLTRKEMAKASMPEGCLPKLRDLRDCPWREIWKDDGRWAGEDGKRAPLGMSLVKLLLKLLFFWV